MSVERFIRVSKGRLFEFLRRRVATREDAEDLAQEILLALTLNFDDTISVERLTAWLYTTARNRVIDWYRTRKAPARSLSPASAGDEGDLPFDLADESDGPQEILERVVFTEALAEALAKLPPEQAEVFMLHELEGLSVKEIAVRTGVSQSAVLSRKFYAVRKLRKALRDFEPPGTKWSIE